jgi:hypothetical protein
MRRESRKAVAGTDLWSTCMSHLILACVTAFSMSDLRGDHSGCNLTAVTAVHAPHAQ